MLNDCDREQLNRVSDLVLDVLGAEAIGVYLFGSAVLGGLRPESDIDVIAVSGRPTTRKEKERLVHRLLEISGRRVGQGQWRRIELTVIVHRDVRPWRYPPRFDFQYGDWLRGEFESGNLEPWPTKVSPDLTTLIAMVVLAGTAVFGPPPATVFDPVPRNDLVRAMVEDVDRLRGYVGWDTGNVVLTLARMWSTVATGTFRSKDAAADWATDRLPDPYRPILTHAREIYLGNQVDEWDDLRDKIEPFVDNLVGEIKVLAEMH